MASQLQRMARPRLHARAPWRSWTMGHCAGLLLTCPALTWRCEHRSVPFRGLTLVLQLLERAQGCPATTGARQRTTLRFHWSDHRPSVSSACWAAAPYARLLALIRRMSSRARLDGVGGRKD